MSQRYICFDVETPNNDNNCMSSIGISVVENGEIIYDFYSLVNPEARFDAFNIEFTGITPEMVADSPNFSELWQVIEPIMSSGMLIAHNAPFDMSVLAKCLKRYEIYWEETTKYACTCQMSKKCFPELYNHRLNTICSYLDISLDHHNAGSDARACAMILIKCLERGISVDSFKRRYDVIGVRTIREEKPSARRYPAAKKRTKF